ncbi:MAG: polymer-forming cytoskeletal protein [Thiohalomonadales bacterium]
MGLLLGRSKGRRTLDKVEGFSTCIGVESVFKGIITGPGHCIIHGKVEGDCDMEGTLIVGEGGSWVGNIKAAVVLIAGKVTGNIHATEKMEIVSTAKVKGKISSKVLAIAEGAIHEGQIQMMADKPATHFTDKRDNSATESDGKSQSDATVPDSERRASL